MIRRTLFLVAVLIPSLAHSTTAPSLSDRIAVDGNLSDYSADEWIIDTATSPMESTNDSRRGVDNDVHRVAVTWDSTYLYVAVEGMFVASEPFVALEYGAGGLESLSSAGSFYRRVRYTTIMPNVLATVTTGSNADIAIADVDTPFRLTDENDVPRAYAHRLDSASGFEIAIPWDAIEVPRSLGVVVVATNGIGSIAVDAAPDPSGRLPDRETDVATLDQHLRVIVDDDGDGRPDTGVSPRSAALAVPGGGPLTDAGDISLRLLEKSFAPDNGDVLQFSLASGDGVSYYVSASVYSITGRLVRVLYRDEVRTLGASPVDLPQDTWDGRDANGTVVDGGVYIIDVKWGTALGATTGATRTSVAVVR